MTPPGGRIVRSIRFDGCTVRYEHLPRPGRDRLVLVHGGSAHRGWWEQVAPALSADFDVVVPDLSGHGDSDHRPSYAPALWAGELAAVVTASGATPVIVVGHSMGGLVGIYLAALRPELVSRLILVDTRLNEPGPDGSAPRGSPMRPSHPHPTAEAIMARFRLRPPETNADPALLDVVRRHAIRQVDDGWIWKTDPAARQRFNDAAIHGRLPDVRCPVDLVYGERSELCGPETASYLSRVLQRPVRSVAVPGAYHHVPLDAPDRCADAIAAYAEGPSADADAVGRPRGLAE